MSYKRKVEEPTRKKLEGQHRDMEETHPAYGQISINRVSGSGHEFYGASQQTHPTYFELEIKSSKRQHSLGDDWYFAKRRLATVRMTSLQFTEMITNMNCGDGVPCTLDFINGEQLPEIKGYVKEIDNIRKDFEKNIESQDFGGSAFDEEINAILDKKSIGKKDRERLRHLNKCKTNNIGANAKFSIKCFSEAAEKMGNEVKREASEFISHITRKAGVQSLHEMTHEEKVKLLEDGND